MLHVGEGEPAELTLLFDNSSSPRVWKASTHAHFASDGDVFAGNENPLSSHDPINFPRMIGPLK